MNQRRRLLEEGTQFEREVLASARLDAGSDEGFKKTLAALGTVSVAAVGAATTLAGTAAGAKSGVATGMATSPVGGTSLVVFARWIGVCTLVAGVGTGAYFMHAKPRPPQPPLDSAFHGAGATPSPRTSAPAFFPDAPSHSPASLPVAHEQVRAPARPAREADRRHPLVTASARDTVPTEHLVLPRSPSMLDAEVAALEKVRSALVQRDARRALLLLDAYDREFPSSSLADEATVLRVDALEQHGNPAAATALAHRFLAAHPASPHASHLHHVLLDARNR